MLCICLTKLFDLNSRWNKLEWIQNINLTRNSKEIKSKCTNERFVAMFYSKNSVQMILKVEKFDNNNDFADTPINKINKFQKFNWTRK